MPSGSTRSRRARFWSKATDGIATASPTQGISRTTSVTVFRWAPRHRRAGGGCDRVHRLAARPLDQRPKYSGGWSGAAARAARPPALLALIDLRFGTITGD